MKAPKNIILVPIDFTPVTRCALDHAIALAKLLKHEVCLLHIVSGDYYERRLATYTDALIQKDLLKMGDEAKGDSQVKISAVVREGNIFDDIGAVAKEIGAYLIVMGTHGTVGLQKVFGSRALKVITNSTIPFVVVQKKMQQTIVEGFKDIVLPLNLCKESKQQLGWAIHLAKKFNSKVHVITTQEKDEFLKNKLDANLAYARKVLLENGILYSLKIVEGKDFAEQTMEYATEIKANLIMAMTSENKELTDFFIGPFEEKMINNKFQIPVMCVNPRKDVYVSQTISSMRGF